MVQTANQPSIGQATGMRSAVKRIHLIALGGVVAAVAIGTGITAMTQPQAEVATPTFPVTPRMIEEYEQAAGAVRVPVPPSVVSRYEEAAGPIRVTVPPSVVTRYQEEAGPIPVRASAATPVLTASPYDDPLAFHAAWYRPAPSLFDDPFAFHAAWYRAYP